MNKIKILIGFLLAFISLSALYFFNSYKNAFMFLSPDGHVESYMMLLLKLCLISLGPVGIIILSERWFWNLLSKITIYINWLSGKMFLRIFLLLGLGLRLLVLVVMPFYLWADYASYDQLGWDWAVKGGYYNGEQLTAYWPPLYPYMLSRLYLVFGHIPYMGIIINLIMGLAIVFLSYLISKKVWGECVGRWTMILMVFFPSQILFTNLLASEMLFTPLLLVSIWVLMTLNNRWKFKLLYGFFGGVLLGLATLTRSITKFYLFLAIPFWYIQSKSIKVTLKYLFVAVFGLTLIIVPWMIRNYYAVGVAKVNTNTGINLYMGNQPGSGMGYNKDIADEFDVNDPAQEAYIDSVTWTRSWDYIFEKPGQFLKRGLMKVMFFYAVDVDALDFHLLSISGTRGYFYDFIAFVAQSYYIIVLWGALLGFLLVYLRDNSFRTPGALLLAMTILYWTGIHFLFYGMGRYHFPIVPFIASFAALYIKYKVKRLHRAN